MSEESAIVGLTRELKALREEIAKGNRTDYRVYMNARPWKVKVNVAPKLSSKGQLQECVSIEIHGEFETITEAVSAASDMKKLALKDAKDIWEETVNIVSKESQSRE